MNQKIIITRGLSGAGKSTWSKRFVEDNKDYVRICRDDIRFMLWNGDWTHDDKEVILARDTMIKEFLLKGYSLVLDETYLAPPRVKEINKVIGKYVWATHKHLDISIQDFIDVPIERCIANDSYRGKNRYVGEAFIREYYDNYVKPLLKNKGVVDWTI